MPRGKKSKSTKKFEKNQLKDVIERRKDFKKVKQRHQVKAKKKEKAAKRDAGDDEVDENAVNGEGQDSDASEDMNNDKFFQDGIPEIAIAKSKLASKGTQQQTGKRKRSQLAVENDASESESDAKKNSVPEQAQAQSDGESDLEMNQGQLDALAQKDPEFFKYLQDNDAELLNFSDDEDLAGVDDLSASDEEEERPSKKQKTKSKEFDDQDVAQDAVSIALVEKWKKSMTERYSVRALRQIVLAFRAAAHSNDDDSKEYKYSIPDPEVYHQVLVTALKQVPAVLSHHLPIKESASGKIRFSTDSPKFKTLSPLIKSYASSIHYLLTNLSDAPTLKLTLQSYEPIIPYLLQHRKFLKLIVKSIVSIWSNNSSAEATRITAFLLLRRLMVVGDPGIRDSVLKATYEGIVKGSRNTTLHTISGVNLMKNSAAEIWGIDSKVGYTTGFTFIRQLAIHLRGNITKPTKDSYKTIYNWQFIHSLDFWSRVLSTHCNSLVEAQNGKESALRPLIYPVVQITLGVMRLIPTAAYFPLRFQLMRSLIRISQATGTYIPLASALLEVLNSTEMKKPPKPSTSRPLDFSTTIRAPTSYLRTRVYQDGVGDQVTDLLSEFFVLWSKSIAFPELQLPVCVMLKRWLRSASSKTSGNKNAKVNQGLLLLVQKLELNARWIEERRNKVTFAPKDRAEVNSFLKDTVWEDTPLGAFVVGQRRTREERKKVLEQGRREEERKRKKKNGGGREVDEDGEDEDEDEENMEDEEEEELAVIASDQGQDPDDLDDDDDEDDVNSDID